MSQKSSNQTLPLLKEGMPVKILKGPFANMKAEVIYASSRAIGVVIEYHDKYCWSEFQVEYHLDALDKTIEVPMSKLQPELKEVIDNLSKVIQFLEKYDEAESPVFDSLHDSITEHLLELTKLVQYNTRP